MESTSEVKLRFSVILAARVPSGMIQLTLEAEGSKAMPRPLPSTDEERVMQRMVEGMQKTGMIPGIMPPGFQPTSILMVTEEHYRELGSPSVGKTLEVSVKLVE